MLSRLLYHYALAFTLLSACGNPIALQKNLSSEEEKCKDAEATSSNLASQVSLLKGYLTHIYVTTNHLWVFTGLAHEYSVARGQCTGIGYTLPSSGDVEEFKSELLPAHPEWSKYISGVQIEGHPAQLDAHNAVLCRTSRN